MAKQAPAMHVVTSKRRHKDREYETTLVRRSYRDGDRVRKQTLANLSHLPPEAIDAVRRVLRGETLVAAGEALTVERSLPHGHVAAVLGVLRDLDGERLLSRERCRERDLCVAMICQRLLAAGSKLSATRRFGQTTLADELDLGMVSERELLGAMDWLLARQDRIERTLAKRHLTADGYVLYDLSSSYVEGRCCPLAAIGYSRDGKRGSLQINYGLICAPDGRPVAIELHPGNTGDPATVPAAAAAVADRFEIDRAVIVGDRGMLTDTQIRLLRDRQIGFVSALRAPQIAKLRVGPDFPLSIFDEYALAEIHSPEFPGERLVVCRNPAVAAERARKRTALLAATEHELDKITASVTGPRGRLHGAPAADIGRRAGAVVNRHKMAKHFTLEIADGHFAYHRKTSQIADEALLDGLYVIRTDQPARDLTAAAAVRCYKQLKVAEHAFRQLKGPELEIRPIYHHLETRVRAHAFLCMLAYYVQFELAQRLAPLLYTDDTPTAATNPVAPAHRSPAATAKTNGHRSRDGHQLHTLADLLADLGTLTRNQVRIPATGHSYQQLTTATALQTRALELLGVTPT
jgi:DDE family transposase